MAQVNLKVLKDEANEEDLRPPGEVGTSHSDKRISPELIPVRKTRRLDVDAVLARSVPKTLGEK